MNSATPIHPTSVRDELFKRAGDPLHAVRLTPDQSAAFDSGATEIVVEGGNQSGKTFTACFFVASFALGMHPRSPKANRVLWYCTTTYDKFGEQAWKHIKSMLLLPGESVKKLPTRRILAVKWSTHEPEVPEFIKVAGPDGFETEIYVHTYAQGEGEFQAASIDLAVVDEECDERILREIRARFLARPGLILVAATPVRGVQWLQNLRDAALQRPSVSHHRLRTQDNPCANQAFIGLMLETYRDRPAELLLRLEGIPYSNSGLVYALTPAHICEPFYLDPGQWCFRRVIDHGFNTCACTWSAVHRSGDDIVIYRSYRGRQLRIAENARAINTLGQRGTLTGGAERYARTLIDPATLGTDAGTGTKIIDLWRQAGISARPAPDNRVLPGIEKVKNLLAERGGPDGGRPRLRIFSTCLDLITELSNYRWTEAEEDANADDKREKPVKREDHCCDCLRYDAAAGLGWTEPPPPKLSLDPVQKAFHDQRKTREVMRL